MGWFGNKKDVPDTIGKERGEDLQRRGIREEIRRGGMLSPENLDRGRRSEEQRKRSRWS